MNMHMLLQPEQKPIPENIKILEAYGEIEIRTEDGTWITGEHIILEAEPEAIKDWLRPFDGVWIGRGSPMMQEFAIAHIK